MPTRHKSNKALLLLLLSMVLLSLTALAADEEKQRLEDVRGEMKDVQTNLSKKQKQRSEVQKELMATEKEIGRQNRDMRKLNRDIAAQKKRIRATRIQQELNRNSLGSQSDFMQKQIRLAYAMGRQDRLKLLLNQRDPEMVGRLMVYHDYFNRRRTEQMDLIQTTLKNLRQAEQVMLTEERKMQQLQSRKKREKSALEKNLKGRKKLVARLNQGITSDAERLKELKRDEERLQKLLAEIQQKAKASLKSRYQAKGRYLLFRLALAFC
jgi:septal ring factor EnvC (AmiA/AmiB activator)